MKPIIIGAGLSGLIAANILRRYQPLVLEAQLSLPSNHKALLRFRSEAVSQATGIPFTRVLVHKGVWDGERVLNSPTIPIANQYSAHVTGGAYSARSIWNMAPEYRWLAPDNFLQLLAQGLQIKYGESAFGQYGGPFISTLPMPTLMKQLGWRDENHMCTFDSFPIWAVRVDLAKNYAGINLQQTIYNGSKNGFWYRATIQGSLLILELTSQPIYKDPLAIEIEVLLEDCFGLTPINISKEYITIHPQKYGKLLPVHEPERRAFIRWATTENGYYSLGRFATWRPGLLLDDLVKDVQVIDRLMHSDSLSYTSALH